MGIDECEYPELYGIDELEATYPVLELESAEDEDEEW